MSSKEFDKALDDRLGDEKELLEGDTKLRDAIAKFFHESGKSSINFEMESVENDIPNLLRFLSEYYGENYPDAKREISVFDECADQLEALHLPSIPADYWKWAKEIGISE